MSHCRTLFMDLLKIQFEECDYVAKFFISGQVYQAS